MKVNETKVYQLFAVLSDQEHKDFVRFLRVHSQPKRAKITAAFRFLKTNAEAIRRGESSNEDWWHFVFPGEPFGAKPMRKHQNNLINDLESFLVDRKLRKDSDAFLAALREIEQQLLLLSALLERSRDHLFVSYAKKVGSNINGLPEGHERYDLQCRLELLMLTFHQKLEPTRPREEFLRAQAALDHYYVLHSLKLHVANTNQKRVTNHQAELGHIPIITSVLDQLQGPKLLANLYLKVISLPESCNYEQLDQLLDDVIASASDLTPETWQDLMYIFLNFSIRRINEGQEVFQLTALKVYLNLLEAGLLQKDVNAIKPNFLNILKLAFHRDEHDLLAKYVQQQKKIIEHDKEFKNAILFYQCEEMFSSGAHAKACDCFWKVWLLEQGRMIRFAAGIYILKSHYEANELDQLKQFAKDFNRIVSKDTAISASKREAYKVFLKVVQALCNINFNGLSKANKVRLRRMESEVNASPLMISRGWLLQKIAHLWSLKK